MLSDALKHMHNQCIYVRAHTHTHIQAHTHTHTHTHAHAYIYTQLEAAGFPPGVIRSPLQPEEVSAFFIFSCPKRI